MPRTPIETTTIAAPALPRRGRALRRLLSFTLVPLALLGAALPGAFDALVDRIAPASAPPQVVAPKANLARLAAVSPAPVSPKASRDDRRLPSDGQRLALNLVAVDLRPIGAGNAEGFLVDAVFRAPAAALADAGAATPGNFTPLGRFLGKLAVLQSGAADKPLTILHVGDADPFSRALRRHFQNRFGDAGEGFASAKRRGPWLAASAKGTPVGLAGQRLSSASRRARLTVEGTPFDWASVTVATGPREGRVALVVDGRRQVFSAWSRRTGSKTFRVARSGKTLVVHPAGRGKTTVLGLATGRDRPGIRYAGLKAAGAALAKAGRDAEALVRHDVAELNPDLIIVGRGAAGEGADEAARVLELLKAAAPKAALLVLAAPEGVGAGATAEAACRDGGRSMSDVLGKAAEAAGAGFWNWEQAIGGACGLAAWAGEGLAEMDGRPTKKGFERGADLLFERLAAEMKDRKTVALSD